MSISNKPISRAWSGSPSPPACISCLPNDVELAAHVPSGISKSYRDNDSRRRFRKVRSAYIRLWVLLGSTLVLGACLLLSVDPLLRQFGVNCNGNRAKMRGTLLSSLALCGLSQQVLAGHNHSDIRINHIQVIGTHNSYHREINLTERALFEKYMPDPQNYYYSHSKFADQLDHQSVRSLEIDIHSDEKGGKFAHPLLWKLAGLGNYTDPAMFQPGLKVFHVIDADQGTLCHTFVECLTQLKSWSDANPKHVPIMIDLELKYNDNAFAELGGVQSTENFTLPRLLNIDAEIRSVLPAQKLLTPDDVRHGNLTLEQSILTHGWPTLESSRGKFFFYFDNSPDNSDPANYRNLYKSDGHESLQGRVVFTNSLEGESDAAFIKYNDPRGNSSADIQRLVKKGYIVRTRADEPISTVLAKDTSRRELALNSGAQIVSTDYPQYGLAARWDSDYVAQLPGGVVARCNPVTAPKGCKDALLE